MLKLQLLTALAPALKPIAMTTAATIGTTAVFLSPLAPVAAIVLISLVAVAAVASIVSDYEPNLTANILKPLEDNRGS